MDTLAADAEPNTQFDHFTYPSFTSTSATLSAMPSPAAQHTATVPDLLGLAQRATQSKPSDTHLPQYGGTLGHLSYAPATQTTVVTTTTTTTTSFPPLYLSAPRELSERDPKQYPLASSPTPNALKCFYFNFEGRKTCFHESDNMEDAILQVHGPEQMEVLMKG